MRATTRFLLLGAFSMCFSACLPVPPPGGDAAIFKRPSRYGWGASGSRSGPETQPEQKKEQPRTANNRFGHTENKRKPSDSNPSSSERGNDGSSSSDSGSRPGSNSGGNSNTAASNGQDDEGDKKKMTDSGSSSSDSGGGNSSSSTPPSNLNSYPYARLVPGKKGVVTLPGIDEINVEGIKPGTPVEIDDPNNPGKKIYFRVP